jgi:hypothetical protein
MEPACPQAGEIRRRYTTTARGRVVSKVLCHLRFRKKIFGGVVGFSGGLRFHQQKDIIL